MTRIEAITLLLTEIRETDPQAYREFMRDLAHELGYASMVNVVEDALEGRNASSYRFH